MLLVGRQEGHPACKKHEWWGASMVICLERGADLHMAQLMLLPLTVCCFSKIQIGFTFLVPAHPGSPGKRTIKRVCVFCKNAWKWQEIICLPCISVVTYFWHIVTYVCNLGFVCNVRSTCCNDCWFCVQRILHVNASTLCHWVMLTARRVSHSATWPRVHHWHHAGLSPFNRCMYTLPDSACWLPSILYRYKARSTPLHYNTTITTTVLWTLRRSACISWHLQLRTGGFCRCRVLLPTCPYVTV